MHIVFQNRLKYELPQNQILGYLGWVNRNIITFVNKSDEYITFGILPANFITCLIKKSRISGRFGHFRSYYGVAMK